MASAIVLSLVFSGCSSNNSGNSSSSAEGNTSAQTEMEGGPLTKYDPPIKLRSTMNETGKETLAQGDTHSNNIWTRGYEEELGIKVSYDWIVADANYNDKMNVTLASGDLPDLLKVSTV